MLSDQGRAAVKAIMATHVKVDCHETDRDIVLRYVIDEHLAPGLAWQLAAQGRRIILINDEVKEFVGKYGDVLRVVEFIKEHGPELRVAGDKLYEQGLYARYIAEGAPERGHLLRICTACRQAFVVTDLSQTHCEEHRV